MPKWFKKGYGNNLLRDYNIFIIYSYKHFVFLSLLGIII